MVEAEESKNYTKIDVAKILGNPKITFVLGGPASGKGTQCEKLVEEFGYTHISTGDLMRAEMKKGTKEGEEIARIVGEGHLVPYQLTVQVLVNALIANPSKNYLIDGFPRALDQALYFENMAIEAQSVLFYNVSEEICMARCMERAKTSGRSDDNEATIKKRFQTYVDSTQPVVDMYKRFGKVYEIDGSRDVNAIYNDSRIAVLPQVSFLIGPQGAGKSVLGNALCEKTNMDLLNFPAFVASKNLQGLDDETVTSALIAELALQLKPRVLLEDFPQTEFQAKFFIKNCVQPSKVFVLECSKDTCQERMFALGETNPSYIPSAILTKRIEKYNERASKLLPFLKECCCTHVINSQQNFGQTLQQMRSFVEPTIVHVRSAGSDNSERVKGQINKALCSDNGFIELNVGELAREEQDRCTKLGQLLKRAQAQGKPFTDDMYVQLLKPVLFSGQESRCKFALSGFPETTNQVQAFEDHCSKLAAIILATDAGNVVNVNNDLGTFNVDSMFQKQFRLKPMEGWNFQQFEEHLGNQITWSLVTGRSLAGKTTVANEIGRLNNAKILDPVAITEECKKRLKGPDEDAEFEGEVPVAEIQKDFEAIVSGDRAAGKKCGYIFDGMHTNAADFVAWASGCFGPPSFWLPVTCSAETAGERFKKKNEQDDLTEDNIADLKEQNDAFKAQSEQLKAAFEPFANMNCLECLETDKSEEATFGALKTLFRAKIVIVNHAPSLQVDVPCANLAIRYNMLYLSVHQLIREHIRNNTAMGERLLVSRQQRALSDAFHQVGVMDAHDEMQYSAVHFDLHLVMELLATTIAERRTSQRFILLEGLCNSNKLADVSEQLNLRFMDELFLIEKALGEVTAVVSLTYNKEENLSADESKIKYEEFAVEEAVVEKVQKFDEDGNPIEDEEQAEQAAAEDEEGEKVAKFKPEDYKWTITNGEQKNLLTLFCHQKGINATPDLREAENYSKQAYQAVTLALDEFCGRIVEETAARPPNLYLQVLFSE